MCFQAPFLAPFFPHSEFFPPLSPSGPVPSPIPSPLFTAPFSPLHRTLYPPCLTLETSDLGTPMILVLCSVLLKSRDFGVRSPMDCDRRFRVFRSLSDRPTQALTIICTLGCAGFFHNCRGRTCPE